MYVTGETRPEYALETDGQMIQRGPLYRRSIPLKDLDVVQKNELEVTWTHKGRADEGFLKFLVEDDKGFIRSDHGRSFFGVSLEMSSFDKSSAGRFKVNNEFYPAFYRMLKAPNGRGLDLTLHDLATFMPSLIEWSNQVMQRHERVLHQADIYGLVAISSLPYMYHQEVWRAFCELWGPLTNTLHHGGGGISISLNDLKHIGGLPILGVPYEEFLPPNKQVSDRKKFPSTLSELLRIHAELCQYYGTEKISWSQWLAHFFKEEPKFGAYGQSFYDRRHQKSNTGKYT